jgi:hypothetical protein
VVEGEEVSRDEQFWEEEEVEFSRERLHAPEFSKG